VHEIELRSAEDSLLVWYWYAIDGRTTADDYLAKLLLARGRLLRRPRGGDRIAVFTEQGPDVDAVQLLQAFVSNLAISTSAEE
jgi:EpsI family protein